MPETHRDEVRRKRKVVKPVEPPSKGIRYQVEIARRAKETGKSLDEIAAEDAAAAMLREKPGIEGVWFRITKASIGTTPACVLERLTCSSGHVHSERVHGPDVREVCLQKLADELA